MGDRRRLMDAEAQLLSLYEAFNARDIDRVLAATTEDVDWPNGWEGGRERGRAAVRAYWTRQWAEIDPHVEPVSIIRRPDGRVAVDVQQLVRDLDGNLLWVRSLHGENPGATDGRGLASSPVIAGTTVVVHAENQNVSGSEPSLP